MRNPSVNIWRQCHLHNENSNTDKTPPVYGDERMWLYWREFNLHSIGTLDNCRFLSDSVLIPLSTNVVYYKHLQTPGSIYSCAYFTYIMYYHAYRNLMLIQSWDTLFLVHIYSLHRYTPRLTIPITSPTIQINIYCPFYVCCWYCIFNNGEL